MQHFDSATLLPTTSKTIIGGNKLCTFIMNHNAKYISAKMKFMFTLETVTTYMQLVNGSHVSYSFVSIL